jgi:hypothetical protein
VQVRKLFENESIARAFVQLLNHPVLVKEATPEDVLRHRDHKALHTSLQRLALFQDFASQLAKAGLAQEILTLAETSQPWARMPSSEEAFDASMLTRQCIMMDRVQEYMHLTGLMLEDNCFSRNAIQIGLLPTLLKTWPPPGFDQPRFFTSPTLNLRAIGCPLELLTIVLQALEGSHFE